MAGYFVELNEELKSQMNDKCKNLTCAAIRTLTWTAILRKPVLMSVIKLQRRIAKASEKGRWGKVSALQPILTTSFSAKVLAVIKANANLLKADGEATLAKITAFVEEKEADAAALLEAEAIVEEFPEGDVDKIFISETGASLII